MMRLYADESAPIPRPVFIALTCDGYHGLFGASAEANVPLDGRHPRDAARSNWFRRVMLPRGAYQWLGPCCSKIAAKENDDEE